jgi:hypothetical protein
VRSTRGRLHEEVDGALHEHLAAVALAVHLVREEEVLELPLDDVPVVAVGGVVQAPQVLVAERVGKGAGDAVLVRRSASPMLLIRGGPFLSARQTGTSRTCGSRRRRSSMSDVMTACRRALAQSTTDASTTSLVRVAPQS